MIVYLLVVRTYLNSKLEGHTAKRGLELGMTQLQLDFLDAFILTLISGDPDHPGIWDLHSDKSKKTQLTTAQMKTATKEFRKFFQPILNMIAANQIIVDSDRVALEISDPVENRSKMEESIKEECVGITNSLRNGEYHVECKKSKDAKRAGKPEHATHAEVAILILKPDAPISKIPNPDTFVWRVTSTKARFKLSLGGENIGNSAILFFRWINDKYPGFSGPWSTMTSFPIA